MTAATRASNPGALVQYVFFLADQDQAREEKSPGYQSAKAFVTQASAALGLDTTRDSGFRAHKYNDHAGHELVWIEAHEAEIVILTLDRPPDFTTAKAVWDEALATIAPLLESIAPEHLQGKAHVLIGLGEAERLMPQAEHTLASALTLSAQAPWGSLWAPKIEGPFLLALKAECLQAGEQFISWEIFAHALYHLTKGMDQWQDYQRHRKALAQLEQQLERDIGQAYAAATSSHQPLLPALTRAGRALNGLLKPVSLASINLKKARLNLQRALAGVFRSDQGLIAEMKNSLLGFEEILDAEAGILRERTAELERMTQQAQREMQLETARRSEMLLAAAHTVEFVVVLYYVLAAWGLVIGKHSQQSIHPLGKLLWGLGVSGAAVFATYYALSKWGERAALGLLIGVVVMAVALAGVLQWGPGWLAQIIY